MIKIEQFPGPYFFNQNLFIKMHHLEVFKSQHIYTSITRKDEKWGRNGWNMKKKGVFSYFRLHWQSQNRVPKLTRNK